MRDQLEQVYGQRQNFDSIINEQLMEKEQVDAAWEAVHGQHEQLVALGAQKYFSQIAGVERAFAKNPGEFSALCIDEGCCGQGCHIAGSGCLRSDSGALVAELRAAGVTEFTTHGGCGAWGLAHPEMHDAEELDRTAQEWGTAISKELGVPHRFIEACDMSRPEHFHDAICAIYDGTGRFNRQNAADLPHAFVASPVYFTSAKDDLALAAKIALGEHGFGDRFTAARPFVLIAAVDTNGDGVRFGKEQLLAELQDVLKMLPESAVTVDTFEI